MRIIIASTFVPHINGGYRFIVEWLEAKLTERGHDVEHFYLPFDDGAEHLSGQLLALRTIDLSSACDRLITTRPPAYLLRHPNKVVWFIHHIRGYYDLAETPYRAFPDTIEGRAVRELLWAEDTAALREARAVFTNSNVVGERLSRYNDVASTTLYPPLLQSEAFRNDSYGDEIVAICRMEAHKRQELLINAMAFTKTPVRLRLCGRGSSLEYEEFLLCRIHKLGVDERVVFENRWILEEEKVERIAPALGIAYAPFDEDSYGYPILEGAAAAKPIITTRDAGGALEFVQNDRNGFVVDPTPEAMAAAMDALYVDRGMARRLGRAAKRTIDELHIDWDHVVDSLLA